MRIRFAVAIQLQNSKHVLLKNNHLLRKHLDLKNSNLKAIALDTTIPIKRDENTPPEKLSKEAFLFDKKNA
ncbi:hypothetical protein AB4865_00215 [Capnocytophaga sp. ARDL2]|uniref:hypothetical protein n=1 Tax=Capnocytophaga sp. ARDL2 TaxID=3238809 RepID=UPI0035579094